MRVAVPIMLSRSKLLSVWSILMILGFKCFQLCICDECSRRWLEHVMGITSMKLIRDRIEHTWRDTWTLTCWDQYVKWCHVLNSSTWCVEHVMKSHVLSPDTWRGDPPDTWWIITYVMHLRDVQKKRSKLIRDVLKQTRFGWDFSETLFPQNLGQERTKSFEV